MTLHNILSAVTLLLMLILIGKVLLAFTGH